MFNVGDIISYVSGGKKIKGTIIEVVPAGVRPDFSNKTGTFRNVYGKTLPKLYDSYIVVDREGKMFWSRKNKLKKEIR